MIFDYIKMFINHCPLKIIKRLQMQIWSRGQVMSYFNVSWVLTVSYLRNVVAHSAHTLLCLCPSIYHAPVGNQYFRSLLWIDLCMEFHLQSLSKTNKRHQLHLKNFIFKKTFTHIFLSLFSQSWVLTKIKYWDQLCSTGCKLNLFQK